jgi:indole-3-pyruvate monooxygenase
MHTLIIGASFSGLATAACLSRKGLGYTVLEKEDAVGAPWRRHYERLHLHTNKGVSNLPFFPFGSGVPRYPSRLQVIDYLERYREHFNIQPHFHTEALSIRRSVSNWVVETNRGSLTSDFVVMATGPFERPRPLDFPGYSGRVLHSSAYASGREFTGQRVLVVGFGNSACEIAIDLHEQGAHPSMSVRSPVNVIPRDILGIPVLELSLLLRRLPPRVADLISAPLVRAYTGNLSKLGLRKKDCGPIEQIVREGKAPVLDIGIIRLIRKGHIGIRVGIDHIEGTTIHFSDGTHDDFDTIVAGTGFYSDVPVKPFGENGMYQCGFWISPTGQIREIGLNARKIAVDIAKRVR